MTSSSPPEKTLLSASLIGAARAEDRSALSEVDSKHLVEAWGVPVVPTRLARSASEAARIAEQLGCPAVLKLVSRDVIHKSDIGGVRLNLATRDAVEQAFADLTSLAAERGLVRFDGVAVQTMAAPGLELLLGASRDPQFGAVVSFGLGGTQVEVYDDVALRIAPLSALDAQEMVGEIRAAALLDGFRGRPPVNRAAVEQGLLRISEMMVAIPDIAELDLNPVFGTPDGIVAVDARVILTSRH